MNNAEILTNFDNPLELEKLYRTNKVAFKEAFNSLYPELTGYKVADYWHARLNYESSGTSLKSKKELRFVILGSLLAGVIAKLPEILHINAESFYQRNAGFIVFPVLAAYFIWKNHLPARKIVAAGAAFLLSLIFINLLPANIKSDTLMLSFVLLPIFLWAVLGFSYLGLHINDYQYRLNFLRYNGDLVIMTILLVIAGAILTAVTIGLFSAAGFEIEQFYSNYIGISGLAALPLIATYITQTNPQIVNKISPVIAKIFSPLVLTMLLVYLATVLFSGKDPYKNRDFLIIFNFLLIGVMAIILFAVAETRNKKENGTHHAILFALSLVTIVVNGIALSAILFRIAAWGITPNRLAVLGGNILMLTNLLMVSFQLFKCVFKKANIYEVEKAISVFLPVYIIWIIVVVFIFPFIFQFK